MKKSMMRYGHWIALGCLVLVLILLGLPGQFLSLGSSDKLSGYEFIFHARYGGGKNVIDQLLLASNTRASAAGIIGFFLILFAMPACIIAIKNKMPALIFGSGVLLAAIFFFAMQGISTAIGYPRPDGSGVNDAGHILWVAYVNGVLLLLAGGLLVTEGVFALTEEKAKILTGKSYSYLRNDRKDKKN